MGQIKLLLGIKWGLLGVTIIAGLSACGTVHHTELAPQTTTRLNRITSTFNEPYTFVKGPITSFLGDPLQGGDIDQFILKNGEEEMPVAVVKNNNSRTFVIYLQGGPGDSSFGKHAATSKMYLRQLQKHVNIVYWDQRSAGFSKGPHYQNGDVSIKTMEKDLDQLIKYINQRYSTADTPIRIVLYGCSWGGFYGLSYLSHVENTLVSAIIVDSAPYNVKKALEHGKNKVLSQSENNSSNVVENQHSLEKTAHFLKRYYNDITSLEKMYVYHKYISLAAKLTKYDRIHKKYPKIQVDSNTVQVNGYSFNFSEDINQKLRYIESTNYKFKRSKHLYNNLIGTEFINTDLSDDLGQIDVPVLFVYGNYDFIVPVETAREACGSIPTCKQDKHIKTYDTGHGTISRSNTDVMEFMHNLD